MKDYLSIEKGITEIINKLNKLKKTAKDVCINIYSKKNNPKKSRKRIRIKRDNKLNVSKGNQYSNIFYIYFFCCFFKLLKFSNNFTYRVFYDQIFFHYNNYKYFLFIYI